jgi:hypothetical protein
MHVERYKGRVQAAQQHIFGCCHNQDASTVMRLSLLICSQHWQSAAGMRCMQTHSPFHIHPLIYIAQFLLVVLASDTVGLSDLFLLTVC